MLKRTAAFILITLFLFGMGCAKKPASIEPVASPSPFVAPPAETEETSLPNLMGFIIDDDGEMGTYMAMYGFLHTAEVLGYPHKLYRAENGAAAKDAVSSALEDGCKGLLIFNPAGANDEAVMFAVESGLFVVVPYDACAVEGIDANIVADTSEYVEEVARGLSVRMTERGLKSGRILVYGNDTAAIYEEFMQVLSASYPQYGVAAFNRAAADEQGAIDELAQFLLYNRDIKGMYVADLGLAPIAVKARTNAQLIFKNEGTPSPTAVPSVATAPGAPNATPELTPNPALLKTITVTIFASGLSDENYALFNDSDIYGLCIEPYYEAAAQATMTLDKLLGGDTVPALSRVNRPIAYADTIDKYLAIQRQVKDLFGLS